MFLQHTSRSCSRFVLLAALTLISSSVSNVSAQDVQTQPTEVSSPERLRLRAVLSGYETVPTAAQWRRSASAATPIELMAIVRDTHERGFVRQRALAALRYFPSRATHSFLLSFASAAGEVDLFVRTALLSLAHGFGAASLGEVLPFLSHAEPVVREGAAQALSIGLQNAPKSARNRVLRALRARLTNESDVAVRDAIAAALK